MQKKVDKQCRVWNECMSLQNSTSSLLTCKQFSKEEIGENRIQLMQMKLKLNWLPHQDDVNYVNVCYLLSYHLEFKL